MNATTQREKEFVRASDLARRYQVTPRAILKWKDQGRIPHIRIGGAVRFDLEAVVLAVEGISTPGDL